MLWQAFTASLSACLKVLFLIKGEILQSSPLAVRVRNILLIPEETAWSQLFHNSKKSKKYYLQ